MYTYTYNRVYLIIFRNEMDINFLQDEGAEDLHQQLESATQKQQQAILEQYDVEPQYR